MQEICKQFLRTTNTTDHKNQKKEFFEYFFKDQKDSKYFFLDFLKYSFVYLRGFNNFERHF